MPSGEQRRRLASWIGQVRVEGGLACTFLLYNHPSCLLDFAPLRLHSREEPEVVARHIAFLAVQ